MVRPGDGPLELYGVAGALVGVSICEDVWFADGPGRRPGGRRRPARGQHQRLALLARPPGRALAMLRERVAEAGCAIAYVNQVGGQDELVFDGASLVVDADRRRAGRRPPSSTEDLLVVDVSTCPTSGQRVRRRPRSRWSR